jgi:hypothetical protein
MKKMIVAALAATTALAGVSTHVDASDGSRKQTLTSAFEDRVNNTATLPIRPGIDAGGQAFWYVVTDSSNQDDSRSRGVNYAPKLANARNTAAVQKGSYVNGVLRVAATVDFSPTRVVTPDPVLGFPPLAASPGAVGEPGYSPLVSLPNGVVINAPHIANDTGNHDKLIGAPDTAAKKATFKETEGFYNDKEIYYVSFDVSNPDVAALEGATFAPNMNAAPGLGSGDPKTSARSAIVPFVNGQTGVGNPNRQGLNSALLGEGDPLNVVESAPHNDKYSPLWDVHPAIWTDKAIAAGVRTLQTKVDEIRQLADQGYITGPGGSFGAAGFIVNCPPVSFG